MNKQVEVSKVEFGTTFKQVVEWNGKVWVWSSNGRVPPMDAISAYGIDKLPGFDKALHDSIRSEQTSSFLADYAEKMKSWEPSAEELYEMRAAFGPGATVVNVVTGKRVKV